MNNLNTRLNTAEKQINLKIKKDSRLIIGIVTAGICKINYDDNLKFTGNLDELEEWKAENVNEEDELVVINITVV